MKETSSSGIGFFSLLALVFITLKLIGYINWSWWWVLSPIWLPTVVVLGLFIIGIIIIVILKIIGRVL